MGEIMWGQCGTRMLRDLIKANGIPMFHDKEMRIVLEELRDLWANMMKCATEEDSAETQRANDIYQCAYWRNIRILFAYMRRRLEMIREMRWSMGRDVPEELFNKLNDTEKTYFSRYNDAIDLYMKSVTDPEPAIDITLFPTPSDINKVEVRVIKGDGGEIQLQNTGIVRMEPGETFVAVASDVDAMIRSGHLMRVSNCQSSLVLN